MCRPWLLVLIPFLLASCAPTIRVLAPDPVKIDVNMDVNIKSPPMPGTGATASPPGLAERRRQRMGEVQTLKNAGVAGENRDGYLEIVTKPADAGYAAYAAGLLKDENNDRTQLYLGETKSRNQPLELIEHDYAKKWHERAYPGEYLQNDDGQWVKK